MTDWKTSHAHARAGDNHSDIGGVRQDGLTLDGYGIESGGPPLMDADALPPGENNVEGLGSYDGTHYWFEFRKELDSGDSYDWSLDPGQIYGLNDGSDYLGGNLFLGMRDSSAETGYFGTVEIEIALSPQVGGEILALNTIALLTPWIAIGLTALATCSTIVARRRQLRN